MHLAVLILMFNQKRPQLQAFQYLAPLHVVQTSFFHFLIKKWHSHIYTIQVRTQCHTILTHWLYQIILRRFSFRILVNHGASVYMIVGNFVSLLLFDFCHISYDKTRILSLFITNECYDFCIKNDPDKSTFVLSSINILHLSKQSTNNVEVAGVWSYYMGHHRKGVNSKIFLLSQTLECYFVFITVGY